MKKLFLIVLFTVMAASVFSQELNKNAQLIKRVSPDGYGIIKQFAVNEWDDDHSMIVYEINTQSDSADKSINLFLETADIKNYAYAIEEWSIGDYLDNLEIFIAWFKGEADYGYIYTMTVDWSMVLYEFENQIKAAKAY